MKSSIVPKVILVVLAGGALFFWGVFVGYSGSKKETPLVKRYETITNYATNYGHYTNYYRVDIPKIKALTNITDLTNVQFIEITALSTNWVEATNWQTLTVTQVATVFQDYNAFWTSDFIFMQADSNLSVTLYKRGAEYQIKPWWTTQRWAVMAYFPSALSVSYQLFDDWNLLIGGYITAPSNIGGVGLGAGLGVGWKF